MKDFYYILGVEQNCTSVEIKEAYRKLSKKFHPDLNPDDKYFESRFREINEAYETLNDPAKRRLYDGNLNIPPFSQQGAYKRPSQSASVKQSKRTGIGLWMTIAVATVIIILAVYLYESFSSPNVHVVSNKVASVSVVPEKMIKKHHKKRHNLHWTRVSDISRNNIAKVKVSPHIPAISHQSVAIASKPTIVATNKVVSAAPVNSYTSSIAANKPSTSTPVNNHQPTAIITKASAPITNPNHRNSDYLYATYVKPNVTGVINMRRIDDFNSEIITTIPAHSNVFVIEKGDTYYKVSFNNYIGYVPKWSLKIK